jgi:hypothetical protein
VVIAIYYALLWFTPLRRAARAAVSGLRRDRLRATLFVLGLVWP